MAAHTTEPAPVGEVAAPSTAAPVPAPVHPTESTTAPINSTDFVSHAPTEKSFVTAHTGSENTEKPHPRVDTTNIQPPAVSQPANAASATAADHGHVHAQTASSTTTATPGPTSAISATSAGIASAIQQSGHNISKTDAASLRQEIKNERALVNNLTIEEKKEAISIKAAIATAKTCIKDLAKCRATEIKAEKAHKNRIRKQHKAEAVLLKAQEALTEATARTEAAKATFDGAKAAHLAAQQAQTNADIEAERLRKEKAAHDLEREQKRANALNKLADAERALAASGYKKRFGCF